MISAPSTRRRAIHCGRKGSGGPTFPALPVAVGEDLVAAVNGSQLFILNRYNGEMLSQIKIGGSPNAGPALSDKAAYVPIDTGAVLAYPLELLGDPAGESAASAKDMSAEQQTAAEAARRDNLRLNQESKRPGVCMSNGRACRPADPDSARARRGSGRLADGSRHRDRGPPRSPGHGRPARQVRDEDRRGHTGQARLPAAGSQGSPATWA